MPRRIPARPRRLLAAMAVAVALVWLARGLWPEPDRPAPWLLTPQASGALAWRNSPRALRVGACPPLCLEADQAMWALSPDGRRLAWIAPEGGTQTVHVADAPGGEQGFSVKLPSPVPLPGSKQPPDASRVLWSPDGTRVLAVPTEGRPVVLDIATRGTTWLRGPSAREITSAAWSPNGRLIAFLIASRDSGFGLSGAVAVVDALSGLPVAQSFAIAPADGIGWDGSRVVYAAYTSLDWRPRPVRPRDPRLWTLDVATGSVRAGPPLPAGWSPMAMAAAAGPADAARAAAGSALVFVAARPAPAGVPGATAPAEAATDLWAHDPARGEWSRLTHFQPGSSILSLTAGPGGVVAWVLRQPGAGAPVDSVWSLAYPGKARRLSGPGRYGPPAWVLDLPPGLTDTPALSPKA